MFTVKLLKSTTALLSVFTIGLASAANANSTHFRSSAPSIDAIDATTTKRLGGFGRLFPLYSGEKTETNHSIDDKGVTHYLLEHPSHRIELLRLANGMIEKNVASPETGSMPLAHVFLGQFIDHDITLDTVSNFDSLASNVDNTRTPDLDLDCIYGLGREASPYLYSGPYLRVGATTVDTGDKLFNRYDLLRVPDVHNDQSSSDELSTVAVIGDPRNDENFAVAQMQAAFIAYHNRMVDRLIKDELDSDRKRSEAVIAQLDALKAPIQEGLAGTKTFEEVQQILAELDGSKQLPAGQERSPFVLALQSQLDGVNEYFKDKSEELLSEQSAVFESGSETAQAELSSYLTIIDYAINQSRSESEKLEDDKLKDPEFVEAIFEEARNLTIHHYHRVIMEDFLPQIISDQRVLDMVEKGRNFYFPHGFSPTGQEPFIPIEFSVAAYRFAHSQVPGRFAIRDDANSALFRGAPDNQPGDFLPKGFTPIRTELSIAEGAEASAENLTIDWAKLIDIKGDGSHEMALKIDTKLSSPLETLNIPGVTPEGAQGNLAARNLSRGRSYRLPSGQDLARIIIDALDKQGSLGAYSINENGSKSDLILPADKETEETLITSETPLWYYIIQEASCFKPEGEQDDDMKGVARTLTMSDCKSQGGDVLGPVGGTLVGEVLWGLVDHYRVKTGAGIDLNVSFDYCEAGEAGCVLSERNVKQISEGLSETKVGNSKRYRLENFLHDAGVAYSLGGAGVTVCGNTAYLPDDPC